MQENNRPQKDTMYGQNPPVMRAKRQKKTDERVHRQGLKVGTTLRRWTYKKQNRNRFLREGTSKRKKKTAHQTQFKKQRNHGGPGMRFEGAHTKHEHHLRTKSVGWDRTEKHNSTTNKFTERLNYGRSAKPPPNERVHKQVLKLETTS